MPTHGGSLSRRISRISAGALWLCPSPCVSRIPFYVASFVLQNQTIEKEFNFDGLVRLDRYTVLAVWAAWPPALFQRGDKGFTFRLHAKLLPRNAGLYYLLP